MNKKKNTIIILCLAVALVGTYFLIKPHGLKRYVTDTSFEYTEVDGGIVLTEYTGDNRDIIIPAKIDGKAVLSVKGAFAGNTTIRNVRVSDGIVSVDYMAFWHCISLESVELPDSVESIGHAAFDKCIALKKVTVGKKLTNIMPYAFSGCVSLSDITLPNGLRFIGENAFEGCTELGKIVIPSSVEIIGGVTQDENSDSDSTQNAYDKQIGSTEREAFPDCGDLEIEIDAENPHYTVADGKIVSK